MKLSDALALAYRLFDRSGSQNESESFPSTGRGETAGGVWLAGLRLLPNALSLARLGSIPALWWLVRADGRSGRRQAAGLYLAAGLTDIIDGPLARRFAAVTHFGRVVDPLADRIYYSSVLFILWREGLLPFWALSPIVVRDIALVSGAAITYRGRLNDLQILWLGRLANALLFAAILALLLRWKRSSSALYALGASLYVVSGIWYVLRFWGQFEAAVSSEPRSAEA